MATYHISYGFDWNSYTIGSVWGQTLGSSGSGLNYYWLQSAVAIDDDQGSWPPAFFQFQPGDNIYFKIWDLTNWQNSQVPNLQITGYLALNSLTGSTGSSSNQDLVTLGSSDLQWSSSSPHYIAFRTLSRSNFETVSMVSPVGPACGHSGLLGPMSFNTAAASSSYILNFCLKIQLGTGNPKKFVGEPEAYIGSGTTQQSTH